jgi:diguanylate cyclase (GGDEF)-like protein
MGLLLGSALLSFDALGVRFSERDIYMERSPSPRSADYLRSVGIRLRWYGLAVVLSALALVLMVLLGPLMEHSVFLLFVAAVAVSALYGGLGPGLVATLLSALASAFFFLPPQNVVLGRLEETLRLSIFLSVALTISWLTERHKRANERLRTLSEELERQVAERRALESQLEHKAYHDHLTDLLNRASFFEHLKHALARARRQEEEESKVALLFMDLDDFKLINDSFGHETGDRVLVEVAARLKRCLREADIVGRLGGDEFVVLLEDVSHAAQALVVAERILGELRAPFDLRGHQLSASASIGIALGAEEQPEELLRAADLAMYQAKSTGKARSVVFDPNTTERTTQCSQ